MADAVYKISEASNCLIEIDGDNLPMSEEFISICDNFNCDYRDVLLYGAEDFSLITTLNPEYARILNVPDFSIIGKVVSSSTSDASIIKFKDKIIEINENTVKINSYKHFVD